jgi:uncharacterized protein (TIGR02266 family)
MHSAHPLGRLLVASGMLTPQALEEVLLVQKTDGRRLNELLEAKGLIRPHQLAQFLSRQLSCPWVSLSRIEISREAVERLPRDIAIKHHMVPVYLGTSKGATALYVAMDDPTDEAALAEASRAATMPVKPMVALTSEIKALLDRLYGAGAVAASVPPLDLPRERTPSLPVVAPPFAVDGAPRVVPSRPPKPPPPKPSFFPAPSGEESILDEVEVIDVTDAPKPAPAWAKVFVVDPKGAAAARVRGAAARVGVAAIPVTLAEVSKALAANVPCALVVADEVWATERVRLDRAALDAGVHVVVASPNVHDRQFEGLIDAAIRRWRRMSYEKGSVLEGRYELLRDLGGRIPGSRWEVRHKRTGRRAMLKVGVRSARDEADAEAVRREQMALARVHHPGAVDLRDAGNTELGDPYIVVEMLEGRTLEGLVAARGGLPLDDACSIVHQIALVLAAAHEAGVRHGAVRPDNVLVIRDAWGTERAKLIHWEAATVMDARPTTNVAHDLAGLGECAFFALLGRARDDNEDIASVSLPPKLASVLFRALTARERFESVWQFVDALKIAAPRPLGPSRLLEANPERRSNKIRPATTTEPPELPLPSELRRYHRVPYRTPVKIEVPGVGAIDGRSEDICEGGIFLVTRGTIADGAEVTLRFALPLDGNVVSETGIVRWTRSPRSGGSEPRAMGVEFSATSAECVEQIARYVASWMTESSA